MQLAFINRILNCKIPFTSLVDPHYMFFDPLQISLKFAMKLLCFHLEANIWDVLLSPIVMGSFSYYVICSCYECRRDFKV